MAGTNFECGKMSAVALSSAHICRICECETDQNDLKLDQNREILSRLRTFTNTLVSLILFNILYIILQFTSDMSF